VAVVLSTTSSVLPILSLTFPLLGTGWQNTEYRSYEFDDPEGEDPEARIHETKTSWRRRRGSAIGLTPTEQQQMRAVLLEAFKRVYENGDGTPAK
jgi:hypothetical protein